MLRVVSPLTLLLLCAAAHSQTLPPPAPVVAPPAIATPVPPLILEAPPTSEEPIVIGEPVRAQKTPAPKPTAKPAPQPAPLAKKVVVAGVDVTGLSDAKALAKLRAALAPTLRAPLKMVVGDYQYTFLRAELGASIPYADLLRQARKNGVAPLRFQTDTATLEKAIRELDALVREDFENTALNISGTRTRISVALEKPPLAERVQTLWVRAATPTPKPVEPEMPTQNPKRTGTFSYLWGNFSTRYDASLRGRTTNLKMAAKHIDGTIIMPGKTFSTNAAIGPRNASAGWKEAKMFVSGRVVSGTGSGICQAASTLYNAALLADFPIVERHAHSMRVTYVPPSRDAALMWGSKDFKFRNTTDTPLKINTKVSGGKFHAWIWGQKPRTGPEVQVVSNVISRRGGTKSEAYKIIGGEKKRLSRDFYKPVP